jgi:hypothetical protein
MTYGGKILPLVGSLTISRQTDETRAIQATRVSSCEPQRVPALVADVGTRPARRHFRMFHLFHRWNLRIRDPPTPWSWPDYAKSDRKSRRS